MGKSFLEELAARLLERYSGDLSELVVLFPSLRARAFFNNALSTLSPRPTWQPKWMSVDELMEIASGGLVRGERIRLITELFKIYKKHHPSETIDKFYFWGEMLIADFDLIDKYLVDASQLLRNIEDIKELEADVSYLTPEQLRIISFWKSIGDSKSLSEQKQYFLKIWRSLPKIYEEFREHLSRMGFAYTGMIYRAAAERIACGEEINIPKGRYVLAGFNALSNSEKILFDYLSRSDRGAEFFWDYDDYYTNNTWHEAGMFMRSNIKQFPATEGITIDNFTKVDKQIRSIACVSNVVQCKYAAEILRSLGSEKLDKRTAIVLTDENMLVPILHSLPKDVDKVNITMGYPLKITLVSSLIERLIELQKHSRCSNGVPLFYHVDVLGLLSHPYISDCVGDMAQKISNRIVTNRITSIDESLFADNDILSLIFKRQDGWQQLAQYLLKVLNGIGDIISFKDLMHSEYINIAHEEITKIALSMEACQIELTADIFISLLRRHLQTITIPYEGEPLEGVQIMGILETRNVDFENVIILSMTDTSFPSDKTGQPSFIPYNLRVAYGLPTPEHHEAMYAYYFYRLIQRAKSVYMLYCSRADEKSTGECSRYIYQLEYESPYKIEKLSVGVDLGVENSMPIVVEKCEYEQQILNRYLTPGSDYSLSPSTLFKFVECPLKFYLHAVAKLRPKDEISDTIDALTFGNILHETMQDLYTPLIGVENPMTQISKLRKRAVVEDAIDRTVNRILHDNHSTSGKELSGDTLLVKDIILKYIMHGILRYDKEREGFTIKGLEDGVECCYPISDGRQVNLSGRADRIDMLPDGTIQVIDYKSGNNIHLEFNGISNLFVGKAEERVSNIFQTLLYSMMLQHTEGVETLPSLYFATMMLNKDYSPKLIDKQLKGFVESYSLYADEFETKLRMILDSLFNYSEPFRQTDDVKMCSRCEFKTICRR